MIVNAISIIFEHFSKSHHWFQMAFISNLHHSSKVFEPGYDFPLQSSFKKSLKVNDGQILVQLSTL